MVLNLIMNYIIIGQLNNGEVENSGYWNIDIVSNGFKIRATDAEINGDGAQLLYQAFSANSFVTSDGVPTTAR